jgi:hypothetical protein
MLASISSNQEENSMPKPPIPAHVPGTTRGERLALDKGTEAGRGDQKSYRTARDSTGVRPADRRPIHPDMPSIPPA